MLSKIMPMLCLLLIMSQVLALAARRIDMGDRFPEIELPQPQLDDERVYLGLASGETFTLSRVGGDVVLVEMLNVLCPHCRKQTLPYNKLFQMIEDDPQTRGRIVLLGVAVGNSDEQIEDFIDIYAVDFPVVSDRSFKLNAALGGGPTPFSIYLRQDAGRPAVVVGTHLGEDKDMEGLFSYLKETLFLSASEFSDLPIDDDLEDTEIEPFLPPTLMAERINKSFATLGVVSNFEALKLPSQRQVYRAQVGDRPMFAEVKSRSAICDVCHNVYFYYLFDAQGKVVIFEPLHLTRYGNIDWSVEDTAKMRQRVVGGHLAKPWNFDPQVDAVSRATMTSAIIFNSLDQGTSLLEELEHNNYLNMETR